MTGKPLTTEQIAGAVPLCPTCQATLIARRPDQRFMENNGYVGCLNGHVFALVDTAPRRDEDLEPINERCRSATLEEILPDGEGLVVSFRTDVPDLFIRPLATGLDLRFGE